MRTWRRKSLVLGLLRGVGGLALGGAGGRAGALQHAEGVAAERVATGGVADIGTQAGSCLSGDSAVATADGREARVQAARAQAASASLGRGANGTEILGTRAIVG